MDPKMWLERHQSFRVSNYYLIGLSLDGPKNVVRKIHQSFSFKLLSSNGVALDGPNMWSELKRRDYVTRCAGIQSAMYLMKSSDQNLTYVICNGHQTRGKMAIELSYRFSSTCLFRLFKMILFTGFAHLVLPAPNDIHVLFMCTS